MNSNTNRTIVEITDHVLDRVSILPAIPIDAVAKFVSAWLRKEHPEIGGITPRDEIYKIVRDRTNARLQPLIDPDGSRSKVGGGVGPHPNEQGAALHLAPKPATLPL